MNKREREITALHGLTSIRDDILKHPYPPKQTTKDKIITAIHYAAYIVPWVVFIGLLVVSFIWSARYL